MLLFAPSSLAQEIDQAPFLRAQQATVFLMQTYELDGVQTLSCVGSGTLVSANGLILTNAHLGAPLGPCQGERVIVALPVRLDEPPVPTYVAQISQIDLEHDLAVLQISGSLDGSLVDPATLNLPFVPLGDPSNLAAGNVLTFVGYPDIGATPVQSTQRLTTTTVNETRGGALAWYRVDLELGGGMSGGGAYDSEGRLVGVPTSAPATTGEDPGPSCLMIQDNNGDGSIDLRDACVPIGAPVRAFRSINFAVSIIEAARGDFKLNHAAGIQVTSPTQEPSFGRLFFSPGVSPQGVATEIVSSLPSQSTSVFLFFEYSNMRPGLPYELQVAREGAFMAQMSIGPLPWGGGENGIWYIGTENVIWPDGYYEFTLLLNDVAVASAGIQIGVGYDTQRFRNLSFTAIDANGQTGVSDTLMPAEVAEIRGFFDFEGMTDQQPWTEVWYLDGTEVSRMTRLWDLGPSGRTTVSASNLDGLPLGTYRLELSIGDRLAGTGEVVLAGNPNPNNRASMVFTNARVFSEITRDGKPDGQQGPVLPLGVNSIYAFVDWDFMPADLPWTFRWFLDGRLIGSSTQYWDAGGVGQNFWVSLTSEKPLPEGSYAVEVLVAQRPMFSANASVGSGTQPVSGQEAVTDEALIRGRITDALTGEGVPGALVAVLDVRFESPQFEWAEEQIWTQAITDREGHFELPRGLPRRNFYTLFVWAEGYITAVEDFFVISSETPSPSEIQVELVRP